jgi:hypothetical protein
MSIKRELSSDKEEISGRTKQDSQRLKTNQPSMKPSESVECLSDNILLMESEVKVFLFH